MLLRWSVYKRISCIFSVLLFLLTPSIVNSHEAFFTSALKIEAYHPDENVTSSENTCFKVKHFSHAITNNVDMDIHQKACFQLFSEDSFTPASTVCWYNLSRAPPQISS